MPHCFLTKATPSITFPLFVGFTDPLYLCQLNSYKAVVLFLFSWLLVILSIFTCGFGLDLPSLMHKNIELFLPKSSNSQHESHRNTQIYK